MMLLILCAALAGPIPEETTQLILGTAQHADDSAATLQRFQREGQAWLPVGAPIPARLGREGLAWGIGLHPPQQGRQKAEGDWRAPAGAFRVGMAFGDDLLTPPPAWPMTPVTPRSLWVEDPTSALYNQHVVVPEGRALTDWEDGQRMRMGDDAHRLKAVIEHNTAAPAPGAGSAIFFHIWRRDGAAHTAGCTAMPAEAMESLLRWLQPEATPVFVLLTAEDHTRLAEEWMIPSP